MMLKRAKATTGAISSAILKRKTIQNMKRKTIQNMTSDVTFDHVFFFFITVPAHVFSEYKRIETTMKTNACERAQAVAKSMFGLDVTNGASGAR